MSNFSYHGCVWGQNRILCIPKNVITENTNKMFKKCPKTMQTRVKLLIPWLCVRSKPHTPHTKKCYKGKYEQNVQKMSKNHANPCQTSHTMAVCGVKTAYSAYQKLL